MDVSCGWRLGCAVLVAVVIGATGGCRADTEQPEPESAATAPTAADAARAEDTAAVRQAYAAGTQAMTLARARAAVEAAHAAAMQARIDSAAKGRSRPAVARTHTGPALDQWSALLETMKPIQVIRGGSLGDATTPLGRSVVEDIGSTDTGVTHRWIMRAPSDSKRRIDVESVSFVIIDGERAAMVDVCAVDDSERITLSSDTGDPAHGDVFASGVMTFDLTDTMRRVDGVWKLADRHLNRRMKGVKECADNQDAPDPPPPDPERAVVAAREAGEQARRQAYGAPSPDPAHPALGETLTGDLLPFAVVSAHAMRGTALRSPSDSRARLDVHSVALDPVEDPQVAYLEVCTVEDAVRYGVTTGTVISQDVSTVQTSEEMRWVDGRWRLASVVTNSVTSGIGGCARQSPPPGGDGAGDRQAVIAARKAAERAWLDHSGPPFVDPTYADPEGGVLAKTHTNHMLDLTAESSRRYSDYINGLFPDAPTFSGYRTKPGSRPRIEVLSVVFPPVDDPHVAYLRTCLVHDYQNFRLDDDKVLGSIAQTLHVTESMRLDDGVWKLAGRWAFHGEDGDTGCGE